METFRGRVDQITQKLWPVFSEEFSLGELKAESLTIETGRCVEPASLWRIAKGKSPALPSLEGAAKLFIEDEVRRALWVSRQAAGTGGSIFSNSRVGLAGLLTQEGRLDGAGQLQLLDQQRSFDVPWVSALNARQIVELRAEASSALPRFRERMARTLSQPDETRTKAIESIYELREEAAQVRAELNVAQKSSARFWKTTYALLGFGVSAYGIGADQPLAGVAGLLPVIQLLINHRLGHGKEVEGLKARPGYVLVCAQDIAGHAHDPA
jgi:hypothetical protein